MIKYLSNLPGWRTKRKIVVIESDDWGSIRMPSLEVYNELKAKGLNLDKKHRPYNSLDTLANSEDLEQLFSTLESFKDKNGNHPIITSMALSANPDFDRIKENNFQEYFFEPFIETLGKYNHKSAFELWKIGEQKKIFIPEFHGREHLNVKVWMQALQNKDRHTMLAFDHGFWGFRPESLGGLPLQSAFYLEKSESLNYHKEVIKTGIDLFQKIHGHKPCFFVPPNGAIHQDIIDVSAKYGIKYVSSPKIHTEPLGDGKTRKRFRYIGKQSNSGLTYLTRNCIFEPSYTDIKEPVLDCLSQIKLAFKCHKPAIICSHRLNYIGGLKESNRSKGNKALKELLQTILKAWPDVEFMTSVQLGDLIRLG